MSRRVYRRPYRPGQRRSFVGCSVSCFPSPASGCKGHSSLRSSTPCPSAFPGHPLGSSWGRDARRSLSRKGKGSGPCTLGLRTDRRMRDGEAVPHSFVVSFGHSTPLTFQGSVGGGDFGTFLRERVLFRSSRFMRAWIQQTVAKVGSLFDRLQWNANYNEDPTGQETIAMVYGNGLRASVLGPCQCCGDRSILVELNIADGWEPIAFVKREQVSDVTRLLLKANEE